MSELEQNVSKTETEAKTNQPAPTPKTRKLNVKALCIAAVALLLVIAIAVGMWFSGFTQRTFRAMKIGDKSYSVADLNFYYYNEYSSIASYASLLGMDTETSLKEQYVYEDTTWYDYFISAAEDSLIYVSVLAQEAEKDGYTLSSEYEAEMDSVIESMEASAEDAEMTFAEYLNAAYGEYMTEEKFREIMAEYFLAYDYAEAKADSFEATDEDIDNYYAENAAAVDTYDYECYVVYAYAESSYDEDGNEVEATDEEKEDAKASALLIANKVEELLKTRNSDTLSDLVDNSDILYNEGSVSTDYLSDYIYFEWLSSDEREAGDTTIITEYDTDDGTNMNDEDADVYCYYVLQFKDRYLDEYYAANVEVITVAAIADWDDETEQPVYDTEVSAAFAERLQDEFESNGGSLSEFEALVTAEVDDYGYAVYITDEDAGVEYAREEYSGVTKTDESLDSDVIEWACSTDKIVGDYTIIDCEDMAYFVYYKGASDQYAWRTTVAETIVEDSYNTWYAEAADAKLVSTTPLINFVGD